MKHQTSIYSIISCLSVFIVFTSFQKQENKWQGTIEKVEGVTVVKNPKDPLFQKEAFHLAEELSIGESQGKEEYMFSQISKIAVNKNGDIYALDIKERHVKVFNRDGVYIQTIGKGGNGPGEFIRPRGLVFSSCKKLAVGGMLRLSFFSLDGKFLYRLKPTKLGYVIQFDIDSQGDIILLSIELQSDITQFELKKFSPELNEICTYQIARKPRSKSNGINPFTPVLSWAMLVNDKVVCGYPADGYRLKIYDREGTIEREIRKKHKHEPVTENDKKAILEFLKMDPGTKIDSPSKKLPFRQIYADDEGRLFVQTWRILHNGEGFIYDIFDSKGKFISTVPLKFVPLVIKNNRLYTIEEDEEGYQYIKRYKIIWALPSICR